MLTIEKLKLIAPNVRNPEIWVKHLNELLPQYGITTKTEWASFLAQVLHESGEFRWLREIWGPTPAQNRYEGRRDLGNTIKGDGKRFMGRGLIQLTGRANYERMSKALFNDNRLLANPELLATPEYAVRSACIYWNWRNMDRVDDDTSIIEETRLVNGGLNGLADRQKYFDRAIRFL